MMDGSAVGSDRHHFWRIGRLVCGLAAVIAALMVVPAVLSARTPRAHAAQTAATNPALTVACGLRVLLILDNSGSVATTANATVATRTAATGFVNALNGTGSELAIVKFSQNAFAQGQAAPGSSPTVPQLVQAGTPNYHVVNQDSINTAFAPFIANYSPVSGGSNTQTGTNDSTNWNAALLTATRGTHPDLVILVTDGNPTSNGIPGVTSAANNEAAWNANIGPAVTAANTVKGQNTRIFALGVGDALAGEAGTDARLQAISGPNQIPPTPFFNRANPASSADWALVTDFAKLEAELRAFVTDLCAPSIVVTKRILSLDGSTQVASGWHFTANLATSPGGHTWTSPVVADVHGAIASTATLANGIARFEWRLEDPHATSEVKVAHTEMDGFHFVSAQCVKVSPAGSVNLPVNNTGIPDISLAPDQFATCTVLNRPSAATLTVVKSLSPSDDGGTFDLRINGETKIHGATDGDSTGPITLPLGSHSFDEVGANGTDLGHYDTSFSCVDLATHEVVAHGTAGEGSVDLTHDGQNVECTITNISNRFGEITVIKHLIPANDPGTFNLHIGDHSTPHPVSDGGELGPIRLPFGAHDVTETAANGTDLGHYNISTQCFDQDGHEVAHNANGPHVSVDLSEASHSIECTITNHRPRVPTGDLEVVKHLVPHDDAGTFNLLISGEAFALDVGHNGTTGPLEFEAGTHAVTEHGAEGTHLNEFSISTTCVSGAGHTVAHNAHGPAVSVDLSDGEHVVCTITNTRIVPPPEEGVVPPPPGPGPDLAVFKTLPQFASVGALVPLTISVHNHGRGTAHGVQIHENRPPGLQIVHVVGGTLHNGTAVWHVGDLAPGAERTVHATVRVLHPGLHVDTAVATATNADSVLSVASVRARAAARPRPRPKPPPPVVTG